MRLLSTLALASTLSCAAPAPTVSFSVHVAWADPVPAGEWLPRGDSGGDGYKRGNTAAFEIWWEGPCDCAQALAAAELHVTNNRGCATNAGDDTLPDFFFEQDSNPDWSFPSDRAEKIAGIQSLRVSALVPRGRRVPLRTSCFDWAGSGHMDVVLVRPDGDHVYTRYPPLSVSK